MSGPPASYSVPFPSLRYPEKLFKALDIHVAKPPHFRLVVSKEPVVDPHHPHSGGPGPLAGGETVVKNRAVLRPHPRGPGGGPPGMRMPAEKAKDFKGTLSKVLKYIAQFKWPLILVTVL